jgi:hypothetical protein
MNSRHKFVIGHRAMSVVLFLAWLAYGIPLLSFTSDVINKVGKGFQEYAHQNEQTIQSLNSKGLTDVDIRHVESNVKIELMSQRWIHIVMVILGLSAAIMAFFSSRFWRSAIASTSILYLWIWYVSGAMVHVSFVEAFKLKWMMAETLGTVNSFLIQDIILPVVLVATAIYMITDFFLSNSYRSGGGER